MALVESGVRLRVAGEQELSAALKSVDKLLANLDKATKKAASGFDSMTAASKRAERVTVLNEKLAIQQRELALLTEKLDKVKEKYGDNSEQAQRAGIAIDRLNNSIGANQRALAGLAQEEVSAKQKAEDSIRARAQTADALGKAALAAGDLREKLNQEAQAAADSATATQKIESGAMEAARGMLSLDRATEQAKQGLNAFEQVAIGALRRVGEIAVDVFGRMAEGAMQFAQSTITVAADYESTLNRFAAVAGTALQESGMSLETFDALALQMGKDTQFSAAQAADAMVNLAKGGIDPATIAAGGLKSVLDLAAAGELDLAEAAEIAAKQLGVWAKDGVTGAEVANLLSQAANASTVDVENLSLGLAQAGGTARATGLEYNELVQSMALLAPGFSSASDAGTSFKAFLSRLAPMTDKAKDAMAELGLITEEGGSVFFDTQGNFIGMAETAGLLQEATKDLSEEQRLLYLNTIFGQDAIRASVLLSEAGTKGYNDMGVAMNKAGSAADQAAIRNQGLNFAIETLLGSFETFQIILGKAVNPVLEMFINEYMTPAINIASELAETIFEISDAFPAIKKGGDAIEILPEMFESSAKKIDAIISRIAGKDFAKSFRGLLNAFSVLGKKIAPDLQKLGATIQGGLGQAFEVLTNTILPSLSAALGLITKHWGAFKGAIMGVGAVLAGGVIYGAIVAIGSALAALASPIALVVAGAALLGAAWNTNFMGIQETTATVWAYVTQAFNTAVAYLSSVFGPVISAFQMFGSGALQEIINFVTGTETSFSNLTAIFGNILIAIGTVVSDLITTLISYTPTFIAAWWGFAQASWQWLWNAIPIVISTLGRWVDSLLMYLAVNLPLWISQLLIWGTAAAQWIADALPTFITKAGEFLQGIIGWSQSEVVPGLQTETDSWFKNLTDWITEKLIPEIKPKFDLFKEEVVKALKKAGEAAWEQAKKIGKQIIDGIVNSIRDGFNRVQNEIAALFGGAETSAQEATESHSPSRVFMRIGQNMINGLLAGLQGGNPFSSINAAFQGLITTSQSILVEWVATMTRYGQEAWQWVVRALPILKAQMAAWGNTLITSITTALPQWVMSLTPWSLESWQWLQRSIPPLMVQMAGFLMLLQTWANVSVLFSLKTSATQWSMALYNWIPNELIPGIQPMWEWFLTDSITNMKRIEAEMYKSGKNVGKAIIKGTLEAIKDGKGKIINLFIDVINEAIAAAKRQLGISSPSLVFYNIGQNIMMGLRDGIADGADMASDALSGVAAQMSGVMDVSIMPGGSLTPERELAQVAYKSGNYNTVAPPASAGQMAINRSVSNNYQNNNNYNLTVNTPRQSQGVVSDFQVIRAFAGA